MMQVLAMLSFIILPYTIFSQNTPPEANGGLSKKNILRVVATKEDPNSLALQYERELKRPFTIVAKFGPTMDLQRFGDIYTSTGKKNQYGFGLFGSVEARYYFTLNHRIKKQKPVDNFSAFYLSLEQYIASNPFVFINQKPSHALQGSVETFLNIGWQKQVKSFYFNIYFGPDICKKTLSKYFPDQHIDGTHGAFGIGLVF